MSVHMTPRETVSDLGVDLAPRIPAPGVLWGPVRNWIWVAYLILMLAAVPDYFVQYWLNTSLNFHTIFFTNLRMQALLFGAYGALIFAAVNVPMRLYAASPGLRRAAVHVGLWF